MVTPQKKNHTEQGGAWCSSGTEKLLRTAQSRDSQAPQEKKRKKEGGRGRGEKRRSVTMKAITLLQMYEWPWVKLIYPITEYPPTVPHSSENAFPACNLSVST